MKVIRAMRKLNLEDVGFIEPRENMLRTGRGTVKRRVTNQACGGEINPLYSSNLGDSSHAVQIDPWSRDAMIAGINGWWASKKSF